MPVVANRFDSLRCSANSNCFMAAMLRPFRYGFRSFFFFFFAKENKREGVHENGAAGEEKKRNWKFILSIWLSILTVIH